ncbi:hypothetical protein ES702_01075 [subsurface metagenome]
MMILVATHDGRRVRFENQIIPMLMSLVRYCSVGDSKSHRSREQTKSKHIISLTTNPDDEVSGDLPTPSTVEQIACPSV